jgi:hypothetical protein
MNHGVRGGEAGSRWCGDGHRFSDDTELIAVAEGKKTFKSGASGVHITKVTR